MAGQNYNPTPNLKNATTGWATYNATLTATADGGRFRPSSGGYSYMNIQLDAFHAGAAIPLNRRYVLAGVQVRRNSNAGDLDTVQFGIFGAQGGGQTDRYAYINMSDSATNRTFPVGQWVSLPNLVNSTSTTDYSGNEGRASIVIYSDDAASDWTIRGLYVYHLTEETADSVIDGTDASWDYHNPVDSLDVTFEYTAVPNELVQSCYWDYGDGDFASWSPGVKPVKTYDTAGTYEVAMTISNRTWTPDDDVQDLQEYTVTKQVQVPGGTFQAAYNYQSSYLDLDVDATPAVADSWIDLYSWDFGDGNTATGKFASHSYVQSGVYNVALTITNSLGQSSTETKAVEIAAAPNPSLYFTTDKDLLSVAFAPSITGGTGYVWDFGDGVTSTDEAPTHAYATPGTYSVSLTVDGLNTVRDVLVYAEYTPIKNVTDALRLEVKVPPADGLANLIENPSGEQGGFGWITLGDGATASGSNTVDGPNDHGVEGWKLVFVAGGINNQTIVSEPYRVQPGDYVGVSWRMPYVDGYMRAQVEFLDAAGETVAWTDSTGYLSEAGSTLRTVPGLIPLGAFYARVRMTQFADTSDTIPAAGDVALIRYVMMATGTEAELANLSFSSNASWLDVLGPTHEIKVSRQALDVGTMTATILDAELDPAVADTLRPGQSVRLRAASRDEAGGVLWESLYYGSTTALDVSYDYARRGTAKHARISLTAVDSSAALASIQEPNGVGVIADLPYILEGKGVPYSVNGSSGQVSSASIVSTNENAALIDQIAITRDSELGYAWVSRNNVLTAYDRLRVDNSIRSALNEADYADLDVSFSTETAMNDVRIKWLRPIPGDEETDPSTEEITYGPFVDQESVDEWGRHSAEFTMHGAVENPTAIAELADEILGYNGTPRVRMNSVKVPIRYEQDISSSKALLDLYDLVQVSYAPTATVESSRVTGIEHEITTAHWAMTLTFEEDGAVASPQVVPSPPVSVPVVAPTVGDVTVIAPFTSPGVQVIKNGNLVTLVGTFYRGSWTSESLVDAGTVPEGFRPEVDALQNGHVWSAAGNDWGILFSIQVLTTGAVRIRRKGNTASGMGCALSWVVAE